MVGKRARSEETQTEYMEHVNMRITNSISAAMFMRFDTILMDYHPVP